MQTNKTNTDIDRKLAIYYHPLFQQILNFIGGLFGDQSSLSLGLLEFLQFNLKLQKCLLPTFELENAVVSGLNDWVKQVAQCLSFEGMVSTAGCTQVTSENIMQLIVKEIRSANLKLLFEETEYKHFLKAFVTHDAFKLLGVRINSEVFCKFLFDLCTTWCEFLDVEIFVYFLLTLALQISQGQNLTQSKFKTTKTIRTVEMEFFEDFQELKAQYSKNKRKQLRYYRAWCEWNYLRMNEIGQKVILDLNDIFQSDQRITGLAEIFEKAIDTINVEITNQIKQEPAQTANKSDTGTKQFLVFKKLDVKRQPLPEQFSFIRPEIPEVEPDIRHDYSIEIDDKGNLYLKRIVKIPIFGTKIIPQPFELKQFQKREYLVKKKQQYREMSNLYRMQQFSQALTHNPKLGPLYYQPSDLNKKIESFDKEKYGANNSKKQMTEIHKKPAPTQDEQLQEQRKTKTQSLYSKQNDKNKDNSMDYSFKVMAPSFLTNDAYNLSYVSGQNKIYAKQVGGEKRDLQHNLPRILKNDIIQRNKPVHLIGKFLTDRRKIRDKILDISTHSTNVPAPSSTNSLVQPSRLEQLKQDSHHIWSRYVSEAQMRELTDYTELYEKLFKFRKMFAEEFKSDYVKMINLDLEYEDTRHEMGGVLTTEDKEKFRKRIEGMLKRDEKRKKRRKRNRRKRGVVQVNGKRFKSTEQRSLFNHVFIDFHREQIKKAKQMSVHI